MNGSHGSWDDGNVVGVLGGLGPMATALFLEMVIDRTVAARDQDHIDMIISQHSTTPDRTAFLFDPAGEDPVPALVHDARMLERAGADFLVLTCNTAHAFSRSIREATGLELVEILKATVDEVRSRAAAGARVGLLATSGTRRAGLYQDALEASGLQVVLPQGSDQELIMDLIYGQVKAGRTDRLGGFLDVIGRLQDAGADYFILGCTELSVAAKALDLLDRPEIVDSLRSLADATILRANHRIRSK